MNTLGEKLNYIRKKNGFTQEYLADLIGVSRGVIFNQYENSRAWLCSKYGLYIKYYKNVKIKICEVNKCRFLVNYLN